MEEEGSPGWRGGGRVVGVEDAAVADYEVGYYSRFWEGAMDCGLRNVVRREATACPAAAECWRRIVEGPDAKGVFRRVEKCWTPGGF